MAPNHTPHTLVVWEVHPSPLGVSSWGRGKGKSNLCLYEPRTYVSFSLREFALIFNLFTLLALEADDAVCREVQALHSPPPLGIFLSLVVLGIHPMFLRKKEDLKTSMHLISSETNKLQLSQQNYNTREQFSAFLRRPEGTQLPALSLNRYQTPSAP